MPKFWKHHKFGIITLWMPLGSQTMMVVGLVPICFWQSDIEWSVARQLRGRGEGVLNKLLHDLRVTSRMDKREGVELLIVLWVDGTHGSSTPTIQSILPPSPLLIRVWLNLKRDKYTGDHCIWSESTIRSLDFRIRSLRSLYTFCGDYKVTSSPYWILLTGQTVYVTLCNWGQEPWPMILDFLLLDRISVEAYHPQCMVFATSKPPLSS